jgi:ATP-dependent HslUV protease subunit HslV
MLEPDDGILAIGSGGNFALLPRARAHATYELSARTIALEAMKAAAAICVYTNEQIVVEEL